MKEKNSVSPWGVHLADQLAAKKASIVAEKQLTSGTLQALLTNDSLAVKVQRKRKAELVFRLAYTPAADFEIKNSEMDETGLTCTLKSSLGSYRVTLAIQGDEAIDTLHYEVRFTPRMNVAVPFWPKDILLLRERGTFDNVQANIHVEQLGMRSGLVYFSIEKPKAGAVLYLQNLTALNDYCIDTGASLAGTVNASWPEFGFALPAATDKPLHAGKSYILSDAFIALTDQVPGDQFEVAKQFMELLACLYLMLPKPPVVYHDYPSTAEKVMRALAEHKGCWAHHHGHDYLNAYVCDYDTPPEIMVQLAVLLPVMEYADWSDRGSELIVILESGLSEFYDADLRTVRRWLPAAVQQLDGSEEHKKPLVMDSWYLHHPLLNFSRMALKGDKVAKDLFMKSLDYAIKVAKHFDYKWPVFYKMDTLEVIKAETAPGQGGEKDVGGIYAHVMLQAWELTREKTYLEEAQRAAKSMVSDGFDLFYQANNTAFSAGAMLRLWKETNDPLYLDMGYLFLANIFKNVALWECRYGYGSHFPLFFAVFPLNDAPYTAVYEEAEVFAAMHEFLAQANDTPLFRPSALLLAEFIRYAVGRMPYYYPTLLPTDMLAEKVKTGEIDRQLWVPVEDISSGWDKSGTVGQEVYGAGFPFTVIPRHYIQLAEGAYLLFIDYPFAEYAVKDQEVHIKVLGDERLHASVYIFKVGKGQPLEIEVSGKRQGALTAQTDEDDRVYYQVQGDQHLTVKWQAKQTYTNVNHKGGNHGSS